MLASRRPSGLRKDKTRVQLLGSQNDMATIRLVLLSFEPAIAGGSLPRNAALAQAYRVISLMELKTLLKGVGKSEAKRS